jgi:hypothetical protein
MLTFIIAQFVIHVDKLIKINKMKIKNSRHYAFEMGSASPPRKNKGIQIVK